MGGSAVSSGTDLSADVYEPGTDVDLLETQAKLQVAVQTLIAGIGEDLQRDGLRDTPKVDAFFLGRPFTRQATHILFSLVTCHLQCSVWQKHGWMRLLGTERLLKGGLFPCKVPSDTLCSPILHLPSAEI